MLWILDFKKDKDVTKCSPCHHFVTIHYKNARTAAPDTRKQRMQSQPARLHCTRPATRYAFVRSMQVRQMLSPPRKQYHNTSTTSRIHCPRHEKAWDLTTPCTKCCACHVKRDPVSPQQHIFCKPHSGTELSRQVRDGGEQRCP